MAISTAGKKTQGSSSYCTLEDLQDSQTIWKNKVSVLEIPELKSSLGNSSSDYADCFAEAHEQWV